MRILSTLRARRALASAGWLLTAACASAPATSASVSTPRVDFVAVPASAANAPADATTPPTVRVSQGRVEILGQLMTPDPCFDLTAAFTNANRELRVMVNATKRPGMCATVIETFAYRATILNLHQATTHSTSCTRCRIETPAASVVKQSVTIK